MNDIAIRVQDIAKHYMIYTRPEDRLKQSIVPRLQKLVKREPTKYFSDFAALNGVSFDVRRGETVGIMGRNGCGKSTLLQIVCGTLQPSSGSLEVNGRIAALLELGAGFNPEFSGRENVYMNGAILGLSRAEMDERFDEIAAFADIGQFIEQPVKTYSSGMGVRLAFAVAVNVDPDIMVIDEALAVGDVAFQRKCFARLEQIRESGATILFVSHSAGSIIELCDRAILLDAGEILLDGKPKKVTNQYLKLVHMPAEKVPEAREKIRALQGVTDEEPGQEEADEGTNGKAPAVADKAEESAKEREHRLEEEEGWLDPNLKSQSVVEYESSGARIRDLRILAPSGRQVNVLKMGVRYEIVYEIDFSCHASGIQMGTLIKDIKGTELAGGNNTRVKDLQVEHVDPGQTIFVRFSFICRIMPGTYFLNAGVTDGESNFLHRLVDVFVFKIMDEPNLLDVGYFNLGMELDLSIE